MDLNVPFILIPDTSQGKAEIIRPFISLAHLLGIHRRNQWHLIEILQRGWQGSGGVRFKQHKQRRETSGQRLKSGRNCRKQSGHPALDAGKWRHTEKMKPAQHRLYSTQLWGRRGNVHFPPSLKLTWQLVASCYCKSEWLVLSFKL